MGCVMIPDFYGKIMGFFLNDLISRYWTSFFLTSCDSDLSSVSRRQETLVNIEEPIQVWMGLEF